MPSRKQSGDRRMDLAVGDEEDVGAGAFRDAALPVQHQGVGIAFALRLMLGDGADHVEPGGLGAGRRGHRIRTAVFRHVEPDAFQPLRRVEIARPFPARDGEVDGVVLCRNAHHLRAAPGDRTEISVLLPVLFEHQPLGGVDLGDGIGDFEVQHLRRLAQPLGMLGDLEDLAAIGALALEHGAGIVQTVGENMQSGVGPGHELAVVPDDAFALVKGGSGSSHGFPLRCWNLRTRRGRLVSFGCPCAASERTDSPVLLRGLTPGMVHFLNESVLLRRVQRWAGRQVFGHDHFVRTHY